MQGKTFGRGRGKRRTNTPLAIVRHVCGNGRRRRRRRRRTKKKKKKWKKKKEEGYAATLRPKL